MGNGCIISTVNCHSLTSGNIIPSRQPNDYSLTLEWFILWVMKSGQHESIMTSWDLQSHNRDKSITSNWHVAAQSTERTHTNQPLVWPHFLGLGKSWMGPWFDMSRVAQDTLRLICGKTTQLQITVYLAPTKRSRIKWSVVCRNCWTVTYPVGIWVGTLTDSW